MSATVTKIADHQRNESDYPLANSRACRMFSEGVDKIERTEGISQRGLAKQLDYKSSVVISHMASGRAPIPIERSMDFARALKLDPADFLLAVLDQRFPHIEFARILSGNKAKDAPRKGTATEEAMVLEDLQSAAGGALADIPSEQFAVVREAAADRNAKRRWLSIPEMGIIDLFRAERPDVLKTGLTIQQRRALKDAVAAL